VKKRGLRLPGLKFDALTGTAHIEVIEPETGGRKRVRKTLRNVTQAEAVEVWRAMRESVLTGEEVLEIPTLSAYYEKHKEALFQECGKVTRKNQDACMKLAVLPSLGSSKLDRITTASIKDLRAELSAKGLANASINSRIRVLRKVLGNAAERGLIRVPTFPKPLEEQEAEPLSSEERSAFLKALGGEYAALHPGYRRVAKAMEFALETGLSRSDLLSLRWTDIEDGVIVKPRQKTGEFAAVPLTDAAHRVLDAIRGENCPSPWIFTGEQGGRLSVTAIVRAFNKAKEIAKIERRLRFHDLRHSAATSWLNAGVAISDISRMLGHSSTKMAERRYAKLRNMNVAALKARVVPKLSRELEPSD
jgi:integrase